MKTATAVYPAAKRIATRQVLVDGQPAVEVTVYGHPHYYEGDTIPAERASSPRYYRFPSPKPVEIMGSYAVGQWKDKQISGHGKVEDNPDTTTHMDYQAWSDAFAQVYGES